MSPEDEPWTSADVPTGPYFHGTRLTITPGAVFDPSAPRQFLPGYDFGVVNNLEGEEDPRLMFFATTDRDAALVWACQMGAKFAYSYPDQFERLYVWEAELDEPEVDVNMHRTRWQSPITSVMARSGRFVRLVINIPLDEYPFEQFLG